MKARTEVGTLSCRQQRSPHLSGKGRDVSWRARRLCHAQRRAGEGRVRAGRGQGEGSCRLQTCSRAARQGLASHNSPASADHTHPRPGGRNTKICPCWLVNSPGALEGAPIPGGCSRKPQDLPTTRQLLGSVQAPFSERHHGQLHGISALASGLHLKLSETHPSVPEAPCAHGEGKLG